MTINVTLAPVGSLIDATTAQTTINNNNSAIVTGFGTALTTSGDQMEGNLDMDSNRILNLPAPVTADEPVRVQELANAVTGGTVTINTIPSGGTTGQVLSKHSNTSFDTQWAAVGAGSVTSVGLTLPADFSVTGSPVTSTGTLAATLVNTPTGTGGFVRQTTPTLITPVLGAATATSINKVAVTQPATNATLTLQDLTTVTGPVSSDTLVGRTTTDTLSNKSIDGGSNTLSNIPLSAHANQAAWTLLANNTNSSAPPTAVTIDGLTLKASPVAGDEVAIWDVSAGAMKKATVSSVGSGGTSVASIDGVSGTFTTSNGVTSTGSAIQLTTARRTLPTRQVFTSGSGTYTTPANCLWIEVELVGGGGGGASTGSSGSVTGSSATSTTFNAGAITAPAGTTATTTSQIGGAGGAAGTGGDFSIPGGAGDNANGAIATGNAGMGGGGYFGGGGKASSPNAANPGAGATNSGAGGGGGQSGTGVGAGGGGGAGAYTRKIIGTPSATYTFVVGAGGSGGTLGTNGSVGGAGAAGIIIVTEHYGS